LAAAPGTRNRSGLPAAVNGVPVVDELAPAPREGSGLTAQPIPLRPQPSRLRAWRTREFRVVALFIVAVLILVLVRLSAILVPNNDRLIVHVGNQAVSLLDLRQSAPISPYLFGANAFPETGTDSIDGRQTGFMSYGPPVVTGLRSADIKLLRFPGGSWGEQHLLSYDQLNAFSTLLANTGAQGMIQARLSGTSDNHIRGLASLADRANLAGRWVDYVTNPNSDLRTGPYANAPLYPVKLWTVGNEPDISVSSDTGKPYTVAEYVNAFIQFSIAMHQNNPTITVFGPEISRFNGVGLGPFDANGQLWMEGFLSGVGAYERAHPELKFHLLDGISFHFYAPANAENAPTTLMTNSETWTYLLEPLRQLVRQSLARDVPIAVTEINSFATEGAHVAGLAALWWADTLGMLMNQELDYLAFFSTQGVDSPYPLFTTDQLPTAMLRVLQLYSHMQRQLIPLASQHNPISIYATQGDAHKTVSLLFVNKGNASQLAQLTADGQLFGASSWSSLDVSLSPYSITLVTVHRGGGADAYSFSAAGADGTAAAPLVHTVCGKKTDALAYDIPC
jgi:hypothetical protein